MPTGVTIEDGDGGYAHLGGVGDGLGGYMLHADDDDVSSDDSEDDAEGSEDDGEA